MNSIILCIPTLNRKDLLEACVESAFQGSHEPSRIVIVDNGNQDIGSESWVKNCPGITIFTPPTNLGVAGSWNTFINYTGLIVDIPGIAVVIANDDIIFEKDTLAHLTENPYHGVVTGRVVDKCGFSLFRINHEVVYRVGFFDEGFYPAYFEDNDYQYRCILAGIPVFEETRAAYRHQRSSTIAVFNEHDTASHVTSFTVNQKRYIEKWGGLPREETFKRPFDPTSTHGS